MKQKSGPDKAPAARLKNIRRQTRRQYSAEEKIRIVLEGLRGEEKSPSFVAAKASLPRRLRLVQGVPRGRQAPVGR